ncbi:alkaline phosphatase [bacterium]|nr:alkaline phosphatase [bacterium]
MKKFLVTLTLILILSGCISQPPTPAPTATEPAATATATREPTPTATLAPTPEPRDRPRIMLFIGDGMGAEHRRAAQYFALGERRKLAMDQLPTFGWMIADSVDGTLPDSGAAATAMATGQKTYIDAVGVDVNGDPLETILETAQSMGMSVGLVSTKYITDATTASFAAHVPISNQWTAIAEEFLAHEVDVILGGGENHFLPEGETGCYPLPGMRTDERNLIKEAADAGYTTVCDAAGFAAVDPQNTTRLLGLFADDNMERPYAPTLAEMTETAIQILEQNPQGYFLVVEGAMIDIASHFHESENMMNDTFGFDEAVAVGMAHAEADEDTLVIVTADHETGGLVVNFTATGVVDEDGPFMMPSGEEFYLSWHSGDHTFAHVPVTAYGPGAEALRGVNENTVVYDVMLRFMGVARPE